MEIKKEFELGKKFVSSMMNILLVLGVLVVLFPLSTPAVKADTIWYDNWDIWDLEDITLDDDTLILNGTLWVHEGGKLTLNNCTLYMRYKSGFGHLIDVDGELNVLDNSLISTHPTDPDQYEFEAHGSLTIQSSTVENMADNPTNNIDGIQCYSSSVTIEDSTIRNGSGNGIYISGAGPIIKNNVILNNTAEGIFFNNANQVVIENNDITNNKNGVGGKHGLENSVIAHNTISNNNECGIGRDIVGGGSAMLHVKHNVIKNNTITLNGKDGIYLSGVENYYNTISHNNISNNNRWGIWLHGWSVDGGNNNNTISNNNISWNNKEGIRLFVSYHNDVFKNNITNNTKGINVENSNDNIINNNNIFNNTEHGIYMNGSEGSHYNTISNNTLSFNDKNGIVLNGTKGSHNNIIFNNTVSNNGQNGIFLLNSRFNILNNNSATHNTLNGIYLNESSNCTLIWNYVASNSQHGINVYFSDPTICTWSDVVDDNTVIENNTAVYNSLDGIYIRYIHNRTISNNNASFNGKHGIEIYHESHDNNVTNNTVNSNGLTGIYLNYLSLRNDITNNTANSDEIGIKVSNGCRNTKVIGNIINNCTRGIELDDVYNSTLWENVIGNNESSEYGIFIEKDYRNYIARNNTVDGEEIYYIYNSNNGTELNPNRIENTVDLSTPKVINLGKINVVDSSFVKITNKTIANASYGIFLYNSNNISLDSNSITNVDEYGLHLEGDYRHNITTGNTVEGESIYYYYNLTGSKDSLIPISDLNLNQSKVSNVGKITIVDSSYLLVRDNNISNNDYGIFLYGSNEITMWNNTMPTPIKAGLFIEDGFHHYIPENNTANDQIIYYFTDIHGNENNPVINDSYSITHEKVSNVGLITYSNCSYMEIRNNNLQSNYGGGIFIVDSFNITVKNNNASANCDGMVLRSSKNVTVKDNNFTNNREGYGEKSGLHLLYNSEINYIYNNSGISGNNRGIYVEFSYNDNIAYHNQTLLNTYSEIYLDHSSPYIHHNYFDGGLCQIEGYYSHPIIRNNTFKNGHTAIGHLSYCNNSAKIIDNIIDNFHGNAAIYLKDSSSPEIRNNIISNTVNDGITIYHEDSAPYVYNNTLSDIGLFGIQLEDSNATILNNAIYNCSEGINVNCNPNVAPCLLESTRSNATIENNTIYNVYKSHPLSTRNAGIDFAGYSIGVIKNNIIYNCTQCDPNDPYLGYGIYVRTANPSEISGNNCSYNHYGMAIIGSNPNLKLCNNIAISNDLEGITIQRAAGTMIAEGNNLTGNYEGFSLYKSQCQVKNNIILLNEYGITIGSGSPTVSHNFIDHNNNGTRIQGDASAIIKTNYISWSVFYGLYINGASGNLIYHNNFINNTNQAYDNTNDSNQWDNGYPSGGNYWSDFDEANESAYDNYHGPDQDLSGSDGIVDQGPPSGGKNPYVIDADSQDIYPLIDPWGLVHNINKDLWYFTIQNAINEADSGNSLEAMMGTYQENVIIDKTVNLTGKYGANKTIIDGGGNGDVVNITANWVNITGFTVTGSGLDGGDAGMELDSANNCLVSNNTISNNSRGMLFISSSNNTISNNTITLSNIAEGIRINANSNDNTIINNNISNNNVGIDITQSSNVVIENNTILSNSFGLNCYYSSPIIRYNDISFNIHDGIGEVYYSNAIIGNNTITHNGDSGIACQSFSNGIIDNNTISNNTWGILCGIFSCPIITYNNITNNTIGIECRDGSDATVHWNNIQGNTQYGVYNNDTTLLINAENNYWGDASGPLDDSDDTKTGGDYNPGGLGDKVSDYVDYRPWEFSPIEEAGPQ